MKNKILISTLALIMVFTMVGCGNGNETQSEMEKVSSSEKTDKTVKDDNEEGNVVLYYGTKGNFKEYSITVDESMQRKEIIEDFIKEIGKHANYDIEVTSISIGNKQVSIEFAESFNPDSKTADKIYDSIYQTCYKAFGATSDYFSFENSDEVIKRTIND